MAKRRDFIKNSVMGNQYWISRLWCAKQGSSGHGKNIVQGQKPSGRRRLRYLEAQQRKSCSKL